MKFMKLGSKPDAFQADGSLVRYVSSEIAPDVIINVGDVKFHLHKFPLLSKSNTLQKLLSKSNHEIQLDDFPGGPKAFEICIKFCYGITVTLNPYNVVAARCAAEYLEMTEDIDRSNLILKIEIFLNSGILRSWKDSIIVLQTTKSLHPWSKNLKLVERCIDSIASKTLIDASVITWSYTYNRKLESVPKDWWIEDVCELEIDLFKKVMIVIKSKGRIDGGVIGEALKMYTMRWLPDSVDTLASEDGIYKYLLETIVCLLPSDKGGSCSCRFLLRLLKVSVLVGVDDLLKEDLIRCIGLKLDEASVSDLLILSRPPCAINYDVELVKRLVDQFIANGNKSSLKVGKIVDGYLARIGHDPNLSVSSFVRLVESIPGSARPVHDGLYAAIDVYLKEHPSLTKDERKRLCGLMDVKKFTMEVSMHAAENERLPLRTVVQVLFFAAETNEEGKKTRAESVRRQMDEVKMKDQELVRNGKVAKKGNLLRSGSRRILDRLWITGKGVENGESKSCETLASSSGSTLKSGGSSSRNRRHSIS